MSDWQLQMLLQEKLALYLIQVMPSYSQLYFLDCQRSIN